MDINSVKKIKENPKYQHLVRTRSKYSWKLAIMMLLIYYIFIMLIAFEPSILGIPLGNGITTLGIPIGGAIIVLAFILTGMYTYRANKEFDLLIQDIKEDIKKEIG